MKYKLFATALLILVAVAGVYLYSHLWDLPGGKNPDIHPSSGPSVVAMKSTESSGAAEIHTASSSEESESAAPDLAEDSGLSLLRISGLPELEALREETAANLHATPPSLLRFAHAIGKEMELAFRSEEHAEELFRFLSACAKDDGSAKTVSVASLCLVNAYRLSEHHEKKFTGDFKRLLEETGCQDRRPG